MLEAWLREHGASDVVVWLYTPMALPMVRPLRPRMVVYDCVDDLSTPQHAAQPLPQSELALLRAADLVITSGPSMYEAKRGLHPNVHYLPSAVDAAHFAPPPPDADDPEAAVAARLLAAAPRPRLGCFGVIDERLDLGLIDAVALARPDWHLVMVGPVCARYEAVLPRRPNIHWLGRQPYERLPHLMTAWDVCLMPYALGASARHLSPIKTLEYMAGEKPVVSTAVPDVVSLYGDLVRIARGPSGFIDACAAALAETPHQRSERLGRAVTTLFRSSWQQHGQFVHALIAAHLRQSTPTMLSALGAGMLQIAPSLATPAA
jgi:glycosyltransferase involved in cell wall biosynthesis